MATATTELPKTGTNEARKLKWSTPRWSRARELKRIAPIVFGIGAIVRIVGVSIIVGAVICVGAKLAVPQLQLDFARKALFAIPAMYTYLGAWFLIHLLLPGRVKINEKHISHSTGQSGWRVSLTDLESSKLIVFSPDHIHLIIRANGKVRTLAVPSTADLRLLVSLIGSTVVLDKRRQFAAARTRVATFRSTAN